MGFDRNKANWSEEELTAAEAADKLYEAIQAVAGDGLQVTDLAVVGALFGPIVDLYNGLKSQSDRTDFAKRLIAIGVILERDNSLIDKLDTPTP